MPSFVVEDRPGCTHIFQPSILRSTVLRTELEARVDRHGVVRGLSNQSAPISTILILPLEIYTSMPPVNALAPSELATPTVSFQHPTYWYPDALGSAVALGAAVVGLTIEGCCANTGFERNGRKSRIIGRQERVDIAAAIILIEEILDTTKR